MSESVFSGANNAGGTGVGYSGHVYGNGSNSSSGANTRTSYTDTRGPGAKSRRKTCKKKKCERAKSFFA